MVRLFDAIWRDELTPLLRSHGVEIAPGCAGPSPEGRGAGALPLDGLPGADAPGRRFRAILFPHLRNKSLNLAAVLHREGRSVAPGRSADLAAVQVPTVLSRFVPLPAPEGRERVPPPRGPHRAVPRRAVPGHGGARGIPVTRNWDLNVDEEELEDLLSTIQEELRRRDRGWRCSSWTRAPLALRPRSDNRWG